MNMATARNSKYSVRSTWTDSVQGINVRKVL